MEEDTENTEKDLAQKRKLFEIMQRSLAEVGEALLDDETYEHSMDSIRNIMKVANVSVSNLTLRAFKEGYSMGLHAGSDLGPAGAVITAALNRFIDGSSKKMRSIAEKKMDE